MKCYIICLLGLLMISCDFDFEDQVNEEPDGERLVLIYGFISPDEEMITVAVSRTISVFDTDVNFDEVSIISDATVIIQNENGEQIQLIYEPTNKQYEAPASSFAIESGQSYTLMVTANGKEFMSTCTIPEQKIEDISSDIGFRLDSNGSRTENLSVRFDDISGENNFYIVGAQYRSLSFPGEASTANFDIERFATDINGDGLSVTANGQVFGTEEGLEVTIKIAHVDELIYRTLRASFLNEDQESGNPFFQPIIPPNNILGEGGYGVFAGFRITERQEELTL